MLSQRHGVKLKKLNRPADQRKALLRGLTTELIRYGRIRSTLAHVKEVRTTVSRACAHSLRHVPSPFKRQAPACYRARRRSLTCDCTVVLCAAAG